MFSTLPKVNFNIEVTFILLSANSSIWTSPKFVVWEWVTQDQLQLQDCSHPDCLTKEDRVYYPFPKGQN